MNKHEINIIIPYVTVNYKKKITNVLLLLFISMSILENVKKKKPQKNPLFFTRFVTKNSTGISR